MKDFTITQDIAAYRESLDALGRAITEFQALFKESAARQRISVTLSDGSTLAWMLNADLGWMFVWETGDATGVRRTPLQKAPGVVRIEAVERFSDIVEAMEGTLHTLTIRAMTATSMLRDLTDRIRP